MSWIKKFFERSSVPDRLFQTGILVGHVFQEDEEYEAFFDLVFASFEIFDAMNRQQREKTFCDDVIFILECTNTSLSSNDSIEKFSTRIDSYLYIYRRIEEYLVIIKTKFPSIWTRNLSNNFDKLIETILELLTRIFIKERGLGPNLRIKDKDHLRRINIFQYLKSITRLDPQTINRFLVLSKLTLQSSKLTDNQLRWKDMFNNIQTFGITFQDFISKYIEYELGFKVFPLDVSGLVELARQNHPLKSSPESPFMTFMRLCKQLNLSREEFFDQYRTIFETHLKQQHYTSNQINDFLVYLNQHERLFCGYFSIYTENVDLNTLWNIFIDLSIRSELNEMMEKYLTWRLTDRTIKASMNEILRYTKLSREAMTRMNDRSRPRFLNILEKTFDAFILKQLNEDQSYHILTDSDLKELLKIGLEMSPTPNPQRGSCLSIIRRLLFQKDVQQLKILHRIIYLFRQLNDFDRHLCESIDPILIIQDEWLQNHLLAIPEDFSYWITRDVYQYLCDHHQNNRWTIYIWRRLIHLSILKSNIENSPNVLLKINGWMNVVQHDIYDPSDVLTNIFVSCLFEIIISKNIKNIFSLPNVPLIINSVLHSREDQFYQLDLNLVDEFIQNGKETIRQILLLQGSYSRYRELIDPSIVVCFLQYIDIKQILSSTNDLQCYNFPSTTPKMELIVKKIPKDINTRDIDRKEEYFHRFVEQVNEWIEWFDRFIDIFLYVIEWFNTCHVAQCVQLFKDMDTARNNATITVIQLRTLVERALKFFRPFNDLRCLCHLLDCLTSFQLLDAGGFNQQMNSTMFIRDLKRFYPTNSFTVDARNTSNQMLCVNARQHIQWSLACERHACNINIEFHSSEAHELPIKLFKREEISLDRHVLQGEFETPKAGYLLISINNNERYNPRTLWYRVKQSPLSTCHLFNGIFKMFYRTFYPELNVPIPETEFSQLLDRVFGFIDRLLQGSVSIGDMTDLKAVFSNKNIDVHKEVKNLFLSRSFEEKVRNPRPGMIIPSTDQEIEQVCEWLQICQYYSHINIVIDCIEAFHILPDDKQITDLKHFRDENCSLKQITEAYRTLKQRFQKLKNSHLQLIKTALECSAVIQMMKKADLYSPHGRRRFQELRDNLTTQFQLQERNSMILNSWIIVYELSESFAHRARNFDDFIERISRLSFVEENSLKHMRIVNEHLQIVNTWLLTEETTVLDNALITMEHLYRTGTFKIYLRRLINEKSFFEIGYSIDKMQTELLQRVNSNDQVIEEERNEKKTLKFTLSMCDVDDHKRQLTFCNIDLPESMSYKKVLLDEQLQLFKIVENIYAILIQLEMAGHPQYQLKEDLYEIHDRTGGINTILTDQRNDNRTRDEQLKRVIKTRRDNLELIYRSLEINYSLWITNLEQARRETSLLTLFSNHQIMILIILLQISTRQNQVKCHFLEKISQSNNLIDKKGKELQLTIQCLMNYLRSLRINCPLTEENISRSYQRNQIEGNENAQIGLKKLSEFLRQIFPNQQEYFQSNKSITGNQQYLVSIPSTGNNSFEQDLDLDIYCVLFNLFPDRLPSSYQILWCSTATEDEIRLFFMRIRTFPSLVFVIMDIDQIHQRLREILLNEQLCLTKYEQNHGSVYYFSRELTTARNGLRALTILPKHRDSYHTYRHLIQLFQQNQLQQPQIQIISGKAGIGKTHFINTKYKNANTHCFSINDTLNLSSLITSFLSFDSRMMNNNRSVSFNISIHAPFEQLNQTLFSLFICGSLTDTNTGLTFSLSEEKPWKFFIEVPHTDKSQLTIKENFERILPVLSILSSQTFEEITDDNSPLFIGEEEELVARFLKAYEDKTIDRRSTKTAEGVVQPVDFSPLTDPNECRRYIYNCIEREARQLRENKISVFSFTKFLHRRVRFFQSPFFRFNGMIEHLGSTVMEQMINEAKSLSQNNFLDARIYLVYDPNFSLQLLFDDWNNVPQRLKTLFNNKNPMIRPEFKYKDYFAECLSWLIDMKYEHFIRQMNQSKLILTEDFTYKLFHIHERKLTRLPLIIEGDTGVGKSFLLKFYSSLLNSNVMNNNIAPRIRQRLSQWLLTNIFEDILQNETKLFKRFLVRMRNKLQRYDEQVQIIDTPIFNEMKDALRNDEYDHEMLQYIWETLMVISSENTSDISQQLTRALYGYIAGQLIEYPLIEISFQLQTLLTNFSSSTAEMSIELFNEYLLHSQVRSLFYRLLLHPNVTEEQIKEFILPICHLARELPSIELVVFFDELNTSSCLRLFKEIFINRTLHGNALPMNLFFTAAINPSIKPSNDNAVHRKDFLVHQLPQALENLKVSYGTSESKSLRDYISKKIATFRIESDNDRQVPLEDYAQEMLAETILNAQEFCKKYIGRNSVSQREIQHCFNLIEFFWKMRYDDEINYDNDQYEPIPVRCVALALAMTYYFRLPTDEDNEQRKDTKTPSREKLSALLSRTIPDFVRIVQHELERFVNSDNFVIPRGVAINQAIREHIFSIVVSIVTRTPLCIIGGSGQSKTLSFQIVFQNLQGSQLSMKSFCKRLPAVDPFYCLGSKYSRSEDIAHIFERAIKREQQYQQNRFNTRCVVFLDEGSLLDEKKMVLNVLHPYLNECQVAFIALANRSFDAGNANRMICVYRSLPSAADQRILAYGCLGLQMGVDQRLEKIILGLCQGYRRLLNIEQMKYIYDDRDFIYMLRELRFELTAKTEDKETNIAGITPMSLLKALEDNFNGVKREEFEELLKIFFEAVKEQCPDFRLPPARRTVPAILQESMKLDSVRRRLYGRFKLIIDESEDESAVRLLAQSGILNLDPTRTIVFRMSDFPDDVNNELRNVEMLSTIKLCMETGKTILMINTGRIHGSLYDVFNQSFLIMATGDMRKIFSKVVIGPRTIDVVVHEDFQCIVHVKRSEFNEIPAPFLSLFQKYSLNISDFYRIQLEKLSAEDQILMKNIEEKSLSFIQHFGRQYFHGLTDNTLYSCLLSIIKTDRNIYVNIHQNYSQLTIDSKSFIEQNPTNIHQYILRFVLSRLLQLVSPESMIWKLPTLEDRFARALFKNYFHQQEHFRFDKFIRKLTTNAAQVHQLNNMEITRKVMIFTRTTSDVIGLNNQSINELFGEFDDNTFTDQSELIEIIHLATIENCVQLEKDFDKYENDPKKNVLIIVINARIKQQLLHIPYIRQLIDRIEYSRENVPQKLDKYFVILVHTPSEEIYHQSSFPSIYLHGWDFHFFDLCSSSNEFHLRTILQILSSTLDQQQQGFIDPILCDFNALFEDCLWDFSSRIQITRQDLPKEIFKNLFAYEFYQHQTNTLGRVQALKKILQQSIELQEHIVTIYRDHLSKKKDSSKKIFLSIYQISKEMLCGKRSDGLVESIQSQTRLSFTNFVFNVLKFIVNDYGLDTLSTLSRVRNGYQSMFQLIDYSSFATDQDKDSNQGLFQLTTHYASIPQTPLYHLLHQRIKSLAEDIKLTFIEQRNEQMENPAERTEYTFGQFRSKLYKSILNDRILLDIVTDDILRSYTNDLVQTFCTIVEKNFDDNLIQCQKTIEFVGRWLLIIDEDDQQSFRECQHPNLWLLSHSYSSFEFDQNDLFSLYSACRTVDRLDPTRSFYEDLFQDNDVTRSQVRDQLFRLMFDHLWKTLLQFDDTWMIIYTFISKYYPSDKVLQRIQLMKIKDQIDFMNLAYVILLNDKTPEPKQLVSHLLENIHRIHIENRGFNRMPGKSIYLKLSSKVIETVQQYLEEKNQPNSTLMIDLQQWIILLLKSSTGSCEDEIIQLFKDLNQETCRLTLPVKQFFFDQLVNLYLQSKRDYQPTIDCWERFLQLLPFLVQSIEQENLPEGFQLPHHPSIINNEQQRIPLIDLFFFYLQRYFNDQLVRHEFITRITKSQLPNNRNRLVPVLFKLFQDYFLLRGSALLLCQTDVNLDDQISIDRVTQMVINNHLEIDQNATELTGSLQVFLSTIIIKRSWNYLLNLLQSEQIQQLNYQWANTLYNLLKTNELVQRQNLRPCHQIQFTLSTINTSSIFPHLHQPYEQLQQILIINPPKQRWTNLSEWIQFQINSNPPVLKLTEIKVMLLLNIYYNYYCTNQLSSIVTLLPLIKKTLQLSPEELRVFRVFLQPEEHLIGYPRENNTVEQNALNHLFRMDCQDEDELAIRHSLVNLLAMILMGGKESFLWTFTFQPLTLQNTFGFGSTARHVIQAHGISYDCGCVLSVMGELIRYTVANPGTLNIPAIYVVYFSTFGALAWHLLLFNESTQNLYGPILAQHAINDPAVQYRMVGNNNRTKVCHFVRARLLSTYHFLSIRSNEDDCCVLLNHCFEQMAFLTINHQQKENQWIKPFFKSINEQLQAEKQYQDQVFYFVHQKLGEYKNYLNQLNLKSQIQTKLQEFVDQMPIVLQLKHFQTELHNPIHSQLSMKILRHLLESTDFLQITHLIYALGQFYVLLHQTFTQLVEKEEFLQVTLNQLYERSEQQHSNENDLYQQQNVNNNHLTIIDNGIKAVNAYHDFADGLIRSGVCDRTQRFSTITRDTPIHYLVTTSNPDEGNIVMRILSVLVEYHNNLLNLLKREMNSEENLVVGALKSVINDLTSKEVSLLQIVRDNTGVITLTDNDLQWIEQLSRAILITTNGDLFQRADQSLNFDFLYLQSYLIRTYLLLCPINYEHIIQNYQCYDRHTHVNTRDEILDLDGKYCLELTPQQLKIDWNHLKEMPLDQLYHGHQFLRQISFILKHHQEDCSQMNLLEFIQSIGDDRNLRQQIKQYEIKDFQLCFIDHVGRLYEDSISDFQHLFTDLSQTLRTPIDHQLETELNETFHAAILSVDHQNNVNEIQSTIKQITDLLNDLRSVEHQLSDQSAQSLKETCQILSIENPILTLVPDGIKCENYVALNIEIIRMRRILQERVLNIEEKQIEQWSENIDIQSGEEQFIKTTNHFHDLLVELSSEEETTPMILNYDDPTTIDYISDQDNLPMYSSLFQLYIRLVPLTSSKIFQMIHQQIEQRPAAALGNKAYRFVVTYPNGDMKSYLWKSDNLAEKFRGIFDKEKYHNKNYIVIDKHGILFDFTNPNLRLPKEISLEYSIIERTSVYPIEFHFQTKTFTYSITPNCDILHLIHRFITDYDIQLSSNDTLLTFFDQHGKSIDDLINRMKIISIIEQNKTNAMLYEITFQVNQSAEQIGLFHSTTKWEQINQWLKEFPSMIDASTTDYAFFDKKQQIVIDETQPIFEGEIDGINRNATIKVIFSHQNNIAVIHALKSIRVCHLLNNEDVFRQLELIDVSPNDCVLVLEENDDQVLSQDDIRQPVGEFCHDDQPSILFRVSISIQILKYDTQTTQQIFLTNTNITIEGIYELTQTPTDVEQYFASNSTKKVLNFQEKLFNLVDTKFILVKAHETCLISISKHQSNQLIDIDGDEIQQRFIIDATIEHICRENQIDNNHQNLLYADDFIPSNDTQLMALNIASPIRFDLIDGTLPVVVIVETDEDQRMIQFRCATTITVKRLRCISCQLLGMNEKYHGLRIDDIELDDDEITLNDLDSNMTETKLQLVLTATINTSVKYGDQIFRFPCSRETILTTIIAETLHKLHISQENCDMYELFALADDRTSVEADMSIDEIYELFSPDLTTIPMELTRKDDA